MSLHKRERGVHAEMARNARFDHWYALPALLLQLGTNNTSYEGQCTTRLEADINFHVSL